MDTCTCSIRWAILWSSENRKIGQNQEKYFEGFGVVQVKQQTSQKFRLLHCFFNPNSLDNKGSCWILKDCYYLGTMLRE